MPRRTKKDAYALSRQFTKYGSWNLGEYVPAKVRDDRSREKGKFRATCDCSPGVERLVNADLVSLGCVDCRHLRTHIKTDKPKKATSVASGRFYETDWGDRVSTPRRAAGRA